MTERTYHMRNISSPDLYTSAIGMLDRAYMLFYSHVRRNSRRIARLAVALLPLMALLVGSCKTSQLPWSYGSNAGPEQFRIALFPDRVNYHGAHYYPAAGYISSARNFVENAPPALMMLTREEIGYIFGKPTLHRQDADAEVWQYKTSACVVDFYFYGKNQLSYLDVRPGQQVAGGPVRTTPASEHEISKCLHDVDSKKFEDIHV